ncbi:MAG: hypothetical protein JNJ50_04490 [Acidobacteria bacterium]|nr:hypothetical protein [Acidobacteriota bacterium]
MKTGTEIRASIYFQSLGELLPHLTPARLPLFVPGEKNAPIAWFIFALFLHHLISMNAKLLFGLTDNEALPIFFSLPFP